MTSTPVSDATLFFSNISTKNQNVTGLGSTDVSFSEVMNKTSGQNAGVMTGQNQPMNVSDKTKEVSTKTDETMEDGTIREEATQNTDDSEKERLFILKLIEASICRGEKMQELDAQINRFLVHGQEFSETEQEQLKKTAQALSEEMLYLKFIQGTPVVGLAGGCSDILYLNQITAYAALKYRKRFLIVQQQ